MECPICSDFFDDSEHTPRLLRCGHTCCELCLNHVIKDSQIACPTCRDITVASSASSLSKNFTVLEFIASSKGTEMPTPKTTLSTNCSEHPDEKVIRYCIEDAIAVCAECILLHNGHKLIKLDDPSKPYLVLELRFQVKELLSKVHEMAAMTEVKKLEMQQKHESIMSGFNKEIERIDSNFARVYEKLEERKNELKGKIAEEMKEEEGKVAQEQQEIDSHLDQLNEYSQKLAGMTESRDFLATGQLTQNITAIKRDVHSLLTTSQRLSLLDASSLFSTKTLFNSKPLEHEISRYGVITMGDDISNPAIFLFGTQNMILKYSLSQQRWSQVQILESNGYEFKNFASIVALPNSILITGGTKSNEIYEFKEGKIYKRCNMIHIRSSHNAIYYKGVVYCIGGYNGNSWHDKCEKVSITTFNSVQIANLNYRRCAFSSCVSGNLIYVFGGYDGTRYLDNIERYHVEMDKWEVLPCVLHKPLQNTGAACYSEGKVMVSGGYNEKGTLSVVRSIDLETLEWTALPNMTHTRYLMNKFHYCGGAVYAIGGSAQGQNIEYFSVSESRWVSLKSYKEFTEDTMYKWAAVITHDTTAS
jgi:hypothetical protein